MPGVFNERKTERDGEGPFGIGDIVQARIGSVEMRVIAIAGTMVRTRWLVGEVRHERVMEARELVRVSDLPARSVTKSHDVSTPRMEGDANDA